MLLLIIGFLLFIASGAYKYYTLSRELEELQSLSIQVMDTNAQMYKTIATGLYHRFKKEEAEGKEAVSESYIRNNPYEFAYFVADIMEGIYGGEAFVTQSGGEPGVDVEHARGSGLFLIHTLCQAKDAGVESIALIHSQSIRQEAKGGIAVSAGGFTPEAKAYAEQVGVELIDGVQLAHYWSIHLQKKERQLADAGPRSSGLQPAVSR